MPRFARNDGKGRGALLKPLLQGEVSRRDGGVSFFPSLRAECGNLSYVQTRQKIASSLRSSLVMVVGRG